MANTPAFRGWQHPWSLILLPVGGSSSVARRAVRRAAVDMSTATTTAACTRARAARALYTLQQGPRSTKRAPSTAIELQGVGAGRAQLATSSGNRAGLGCLEHLRNALSFAVVTEWPVGVYPRRRRWSPPHACLVRAVGQSSPCECMSGQNKDLICCRRRRRSYLHRGDHQERCDGLPLLTYPQADQEGANVQRTPSQLNRALLKTGQDIYGADLTSRRVLLAVIGAE